ncbi:MAG: hypothetical protein GKS06_13515 [Acidobacteria bacterium]|nr:hypothetical protein [Acidobacteriota bacterium]
MFILRGTALLASVLFATAALGTVPHGSGGEDESLGLGPTFNASDVLETVPVSLLADCLLRWGPRSEEVLSVLSRTFEYSGPVSDVADYLVAVASTMASSLDERGDWTDEELDRLLTVQLVNPGRFAESQSFRYQVAALLRRANSVSLSDVLRLAMLERILNNVGVDYGIGEDVAASWGLVRRESSARVNATPETQIVVDALEPIEATLVALTSQFIGVAEASDFLAGLQRYAPDRDILAVVDQRLANELEPIRWPRTEFLSALGLQLSPWPRDPLLLGRRGDGGVEVVIRPDLQVGREFDNDLGKLVVAQLPDQIDERWRAATWRTASQPFHNGQILLTPNEVLVSLHSLERAALDHLGLQRGPTGNFATGDGIDEYLAALDFAAQGLGTLFGREPRFVHDLPRQGETAARRKQMTTLLGGGGFDLDSLATVISGDSGDAERVLVGDLRLGVQLLEELNDVEIHGLREVYGMDADADVVGQIRDWIASERGLALGAFLDDIANHMASSTSVERLPLLLTPTTVLADREEIAHEDFLIGWQNVVITKSVGGFVAEGFASGIPRGDRLAAAAFAAGNVDMHYLPPLVSGVIRNGGYRCSTNHLHGLSATSRKLAGATE